MNRSHWKGSRMTLELRDVTEAVGTQDVSPGPPQGEAFVLGGVGRVRFFSRKGRLFLRLRRSGRKGSGQWFEVIDVEAEDCLCGGV